MPPTNDGRNVFKDKQHKCVINGCDASYSKPYTLKVHMRKHTGERPYVCDFPGCSLSYTNAAHLKRHKCVVHEKSEEVTCPEKGCGLVFSNKYSLKKHHNNKHKATGTEFQCAICSQGFKKKRQLKRHVFLHRDPDTPFKCSICNRSFSEIHLFNKHNRNHKTYTCDCGIAFNKWSLFCEHRRTSCKVKRVDHECIICKKVFTTKTNLKAHAMTHLEESQRDLHHCPYIGCNRSYKYKHNVNAHVASFHEKCDVSVECYQCGKRLKSKVNLIRHIAKVHTQVRKRKTKRAPRKDKGLPKKCMASIVSGVDLPLKDHFTIIAKSGDPNNSDALLKQSSNDAQKESIEIQKGGETLVCDGTNDEENEKLKISSISNTEKVLNEDMGENKSAQDVEPNLQPDEVLLTMCDSVLKNIEDQLDKLPNINSQLVF